MCDVVCTGKEMWKESHLFLKPLRTLAVFANFVHMRAGTPVTLYNNRRKIQSQSQREATVVFQSFGDEESYHSAKPDSDNDDESLNDFLVE